MGACDFMNYSFGKTAQEAFSHCVQQAQYEHGHGGYSGTIAEKHDFVVLPKPPTRLSVERLAGCAINCEDTYMHWRPLKEGENRYSAGWTKSTFDGDGDETVFVAERKKMPPKLKPWVERAAQVAADKWGPAACVEITGKAAKAYRERAGLKGKQGKLFLFFGLASS